jgi:hypothetical protein
MLTIHEFKHHRDVSPFFETIGWNYLKDFFKKQEVKESKRIETTASF